MLCLESMVCICANRPVLKDGIRSLGKNVLTQCTMTAKECGRQDAASYIRKVW